MIAVRERLLARDVEIARGRLDPSMVLNLTGYPGGGSILQDRSLYRNNGTLNAPVWTRLPSGLWVLDFDGLDDNVATGNDATDLSAGCTFRTWLQVHANPTEGLVFRPVLAKGSGVRGLVWHISGYAGSPGLAMVANTQGDTPTYWATYQLPIDTTWRHIVGTWDGTRDRLYVNGVLVATSGQDDTWTTATAPFLMRASDRPLDSWQALSVICSGAWTLAQVGNDYQKDKPFFVV